MDLEPHRIMDVLVLSSSLDAMFQKAKIVGRCPAWSEYHHFNSHLAPGLLPRPIRDPEINNPWVRFLGIHWSGKILVEVVVKRRTTVVVVVVVTRMMIKAKCAMKTVETSVPGSQPRFGSLSYFLLQNKVTEVMEFQAIADRF